MPHIMAYVCNSDFPEEIGEASIEGFSHTLPKLASKHILVSSIYLCLC